MYQISMAKISRYEARSINWILKKYPNVSLGYSYPSLKKGGTALEVCGIYIDTHKLRNFEKYNLIDFLKSPDYLITNSEDIEYIQNILNSGLVDNNYSINYIPKEKIIYFIEI